MVSARRDSGLGIQRTEFKSKMVLMEHVMATGVEYIVIRRVWGYVRRAARAGRAQGRTR